jgi:hypothetical protein
MRVDPRAGKPAAPSVLVDVPRPDVTRDDTGSYIVLRDVLGGGPPGLV